MPPPGTGLRRPLSLLLLVALRLFAGASPLRSPSGRRAHAAPEASSAAAAPSPLPWGTSRLQPAAAAGGAGDPAAEGGGGGGSSKPAIMNRQKAVESSHTESRTSSSATENANAFSTFDSDEGRTLWLITDSVSVSTAAIGRTPSYSETVQSSDLAQDSSSVIQTRRADAPSNTLDISELETVPLMTHVPHTLIPLLSEHNSPATGSNHHRDGNWDVESTTSSLHTESTDSSTFTVNRERTSQFLADSVTLTNSATKNSVSQTEISVSSDQTQFTSQTTQSRGGSTTSNFIHFPDSLARTVLTHSYLYPNTAADGGNDQRSNSRIKQIIFSSQTDGVSLLNISDRSEGRTLQALTDLSHSHNATQTSISSGNEISSAVSHTHSSYMSTPEQTSRIRLSPGDMEFTATALVHSRTHSETTDDRNSQHTSTVEKRDTQTDSTFSSATLFRDRVGTLKALTNKIKTMEEMEMSAFSLEDVSSSSLTQTSSLVVESRKNHFLSTEKDFTETSEEPLHTYSSQTSFYLPSTVDLSNAKTEQHIVNTSNTGKKGPQTESTFSSVASFSGRKVTLESLTNTSRFTETISLSTFDLDNVSSSDLTSVTMETGRNPSSSKEAHFTETSERPLLRYFPKTSNYSPSTMDLSSPGKSHPINVSDPQGRISRGSTDSLYFSTTFMHGAERTLRSLPDNSTTDAVKGSISNTEASRSSNTTLTLPSVAETEEHNVSLSEGQFIERSTKRLLEHSSLVPIYASSSEDPSSIVSSHNREGSSSTGTSRSYSDTMSSSVLFSSGEEQTLQSATNTTFTEVTESSSSHMEKSSTSELNHSLSGIYSETTDLDTSGPSAVSVQSFTSSRITTDSSFQSEPSGPGKSRPINVSDPQGRISRVSTDSLYLSTTFMHGAERTLRSLPDNSTLDAAKGSISNTEASSSSNTTLTLPSVAETEEHNVSLSEGQFTERSTKRLLEHSSLVPVYTSSSEDPSSIVSSHHIEGSSNTETGASHSSSDTMSSSVSFSSGEERTLQSVTNTTFTEVTESSSSHMEKSSTSELNHSLSGVYSETTGLDISGPSTVSVQSFTSSRITTDSSFQSEPSGPGKSHPFNVSDPQGRISSVSTDSLYLSTTFMHGAERTLRSLPDKSTSDAAEGSISNTEASSSSNTTLSSVTETEEHNVSLSEGQFTERSTERLLEHSSLVPVYASSSEDPSTFGSSHHREISSATETGASRSYSDTMSNSVPFSSREERTLQPVTNTTFTEVTESSSSHMEKSSTSELNHSLSGVYSETTGLDISGPSTVSVQSFTSSRITTDSSFQSEPSGPGKSHPINVSDPQGRISSVSTDSLYLSTTFMHGAERTLRSLPDNSTSDAAEGSISNTEASSSSNTTLSSVTDTEEHNVSLSEGQFTERSTERLLEHSSLVPVYTSSSEDPSTVESIPHREHSSATETEDSYSYSDTMSSSVPFSSGEERTSQSVTNTTFTEVTESSSSYMENSSTSELDHSLSGIYSETTDLDTSGPSTVSVQSFTSSRITTDSSFQSEPSDTENDIRTMDSTDTENRSSISHTDSTYISTPFTKDGERTLLSVSNNSTSFYAEISSPSESIQSMFSVTQNIGSNLSSSDRDFYAPSTEPLAVQSPKTAEYSSTVSYSVPEPTSDSSLSFLSSSQATPLQSSLPPTHSPPLFSSSETSWLASSSAFPTLLSSQTPSLIPSPRLSSTALPTFSPFLSTLPSSASTASLLQPGMNLETSVSEIEPEGTTGIDAATGGSSTSEFDNQTRTYALKDNTGFSSTGSSLLQTETTEQFTNHSASEMISLGKTESSQEQNVSFSTSSVEKSVQILTTSAYLSESTTVSGTAEASPSMLPKTTTQKDVSLVEVTTGKTLPNTTGSTSGLPTLASATDYSGTTKSPKVQSPTEMFHTSGRTTKGMEMTSAPTVKVTEHHLYTTHPLKTFPSSEPTTRPFSILPVPTKPTTVTTSHSKDIDECLSNPCPALATCTNTQGSFQCKCSLGYQMEKGKCNLVRTFVGQFPLRFNTTGGKYLEFRQIEEAIIITLNNSLSTLPGYYASTVQVSRQSGISHVYITSTFSVVSNVTLYDIVSTVRSHIRACKESSETCQFMSGFLQLHRAGGLCEHKDPECDKETSACVDFDGIAECQCKPGYFRYNKLDHSCRACEDGYKLENDTCVRCPFGFGGFNCGNPYQLITIVIAAAGGGLLLILGIALIVTCCQKNKNDISKLIFKSGDFQLSPYAEYPKNPRTQEWGRETIEMQENGSTKNLLQMTDVYYMPTNLRNPELERNGLYPPYTGLPGSRHSCIYPGQYNPSFISDDSRRRDYF